MIKTIISVVFLSFFSCSLNFNNKIGPSWKKNTTKKRMNYVIQKILFEELNNDTIYITDELQLRDIDNHIPLVLSPITSPSRYLKFEKHNNLSEKIKFKYDKKFDNNVNILSLQQIENINDKLKWHYVSPIIQIEGTNTSNFDCDVDQYDAFIQIIIILKIPGKLEIIKGKPNIVHVSHLYLLKSDKKNGFIDHCLIYEGG